MSRLATPVQARPTPAFGKLSAPCGLRSNLHHSMRTRNWLKTRQRLDTDNEKSDPARYLSHYLTRIQQIDMSPSGQAWQGGDRTMQLDFRMYPKS